MIRKNLCKLSIEDISNFQPPNYQFKCFLGAFHCYKKSLVKIFKDQGRVQYKTPVSNTLKQSERKSTQFQKIRFM